MSSSESIWKFQNIWPWKSLDQDLWFIPWQKLTIRYDNPSSQYPMGVPISASTISNESTLSVYGRLALAEAEQSSGIVVSVSDKTLSVIGCYQSRMFAMPADRSDYEADKRHFKSRISVGNRELAVILGAKRAHIAAGKPHLADALEPRRVIFQQSIMNDEKTMRRWEWILRDFRPRSIMWHSQVVYELEPTMTVDRLESICGRKRPEDLPSGTYDMMHQLWVKWVGADFDYDMDTPGFLKTQHDTGEMREDLVERDRANDQMEEEEEQKNAREESVEERKKEMKLQDEKAEKEVARVYNDNDGGEDNDEQEKTTAPSEAPSSPLSSAPSSPLSPAS